MSTDNLNATNPLQYDSPDLDWRLNGEEDHVSRVYFREQLDLASSEDFLQGKSVLDVGCGIGQLFNWLNRRGATKIVGIDPSKRNIEISKERYPSVTLIQTTLEKFVKDTKDKFDVAFAIFVFEHIKNLSEAFSQIYSILNDNGEFHLIIGDKEYGISNDKEIRGSKLVSVEIINDLGNGAVETKTIRQEKDQEPIIIFDIFRPIEEVKKAGLQSGFNHVKHLPILGPVSYAPQDRKYVNCHLLIFRK